MFSFFKKKKGRSGQLAVGLGRHGIALVRTAAGNERPALTHCSFHPCAGPAEWRDTLIQAVTENGLGDQPCLSYLEPGDYKLLLVESPAGLKEEAEIRSAIRWQIKEMLDFPAQEAATDILSIPGQRGATPMIYAVAARNGLVQERAALLRDAGLELEAMEIPEQALRNIAALFPEERQGVATLCLTQEYGLIAITRQGALTLARNVETGSRALMAAVGAGSSEEELSPEGMMLLDNLLLELQRSLDYYESHFTHPPLGALFLPPLPQETPLFAAYLRRNLAPPVKGLDLTEALACAEPLGAELQSRCLLAVGTALRGLVAAADDRKEG